jgi:hypothetical protein
MRARRRHRRPRNRVAAIVILGLSLLLPVDAAALDSDLKGSAVFRLEASHGYTIFGFAASERLDGRGSIVLIVHRKGATAIYGAPATITPTRLEADLGTLGRFSAEIAPSGKKKQLRSRCNDEVDTVEPHVYRGRFEFHGEQAYTDVVATDVPEYSRFSLDFTCQVVVSEEEWGRGLPGARLHASFRRHDRRLSLQLNKNRPDAATSFSATLAETRNGIGIQRTVSGRRPPGAFEYEPLLGAATVELSPPFSGVASFRRGAAPANRWTGTLSVDFPGKSNVSLTGGAFSAHLVHAQITR